MRSRLKGFIRYTCLVVLILSLSTTAAYAGTKPVLNHGTKWRIGYYEGGSYINYPINLIKIVKGLVELGWIEPIDFPEFEDPTDSRSVWHFLVQQTKSDFIQFVGDAYWSAQWSQEKRSSYKIEIINRLNNQKDIDFMIAMGTWAGQDLSNNAHSTPTMAVSVSDPVKSGMSASAEHSGLKHFHAKCDPDRYVRQIRLFHRLVKFKKLGVVYENTVEGRSYAALEEIMQAAKERNFTVVTCELPHYDTDFSGAMDDIIKCHEKLSQEVDAVFITLHQGFDLSRMKELIAPFLAHKIPTWSQRGMEEVQKGVLFSIRKSSFDAVGKYHATVMARTFNGETIGEISQIFTEPEFIAVNKKTAEIIGYKIPPSILKVADVIYDDIDYK